MTKTMLRIAQHKTALIFIALMVVALVCMPLVASADVTPEVVPDDASAEVTPEVGPDDASVQFGLKKYSNTANTSTSLGLGSTSLDSAVVGLINVALGFLGLIAVIIILIGGFKWMTAGGNEDKVGEARKTIFAGIIGLAIILFAWGITTFVVTHLGKASGLTTF